MHCIEAYKIFVVKKNVTNCIVERLLWRGFIKKSTYRFFIFGAAGCKSNAVEKA
jgi:hypothetical protein